jgi:hypothetical protein
MVFLVVSRPIAVVVLVQQGWLRAVSLSEYSLFEYP